VSAAQPTTPKNKLDAAIELINISGAPYRLMAEVTADGTEAQRAAVLVWEVFRFTFDVFGNGGKVGRS
jgi:hypothetical protein